MGNKIGRPRKPIKYEVDLETGCWNCVSHAGAHGYPMLRIGNTARTMARLILIDQGIDMDGLDAMHSCDNPTCINPNHLSAGTRLQNMKDSSLRDRQGRKLTNKKVIEIYFSNRSSLDVSIEHKCSRSLIVKIKSKVRWSNVTNNLPTPDPWV